VVPGDVHQHLRDVAPGDIGCDNLMEWLRIYVQVPRGLGEGAGAQALGRSREISSRERLNRNGFAGLLFGNFGLLYGSFLITARVATKLNLSE
jgi:hypothetical protein